MSEKAADVLILNNPNIENEYHSVAVKPTCHAGVAPLLDISNSEMMTEPIASLNPTKTSMKRPPSDDEESVEVGNVKKIKLLDQDVGDVLEDGINEKVDAIGNDVINRIENHIVVQKEEIEYSKFNGTHVEVASDATDENVKCENKSDLNGETTSKTENAKTFSNIEKVTSLEGAPENSTTEKPHADTCKRLLDDNQSNANIENEAICDNSNLNSSVNLTASVHNNIDTNTKTDESTVPPCDSSSEKDAESKLNSIQPAPSECTDLNSPNDQSLLVSYSDSKSSLSNGNTNEPKTESVSGTKDNLHIEEKTVETNNVDNADIFAERDFDDIECLESKDKTTESIELADKVSDFDNGECLELTEKTTESIELADKESDFGDGECLELTDKTTESIELADKESDYGDGECLELTDKTTESIELADKESDYGDGECLESTNKTTESIELVDKESDFDGGECSKDKTTESIELVDKESDFDNGECSKDKTTESIELVGKESDFDDGECSKDKTTESIELADKKSDFDNGESSKDKTTESIELADKEIVFDNGECLEPKDKTTESIELADNESDFDFDNVGRLESTDKTTESIALGKVSDTIDDDLVIIPEKKSSKLENDKSENVVLEKEESQSEENHSKEANEISSESDEALSKEDESSTQRISDENQRIDDISPQYESDKTQTIDDEISAQNKLDEKLRAEIEISTLGDCEIEISKTEEEGLDQNKKEMEETKYEERKINSAHEMEVVDIPVIDVDDKIKVENVVVNQLKNTEIPHIEQGKQMIDQEKNHNERCSNATIEDDDISDEPQVKKIKLNEADSALIEDNVENDDCKMIDSSNSGIIKEDLKVDSEDVPMETELTLPLSEIANSTSKNIVSSKKTESSTCEPEKLLNVPTDEPLVATRDMQDDANEPDVKEHDIKIKTESPESETVDNSGKVEEKNTYETNVREAEELVLVKEVNKVIEEIDTTKDCKTETLPNENSNSFEDSHIKAEKTDEAKECKNETVIIADSLKNSNLEKNVADDVHKCDTESESNKAEDALGQPVKQDLTTQEKEESTDDDVAIVNISSKEIVNLADTSEEHRSESTNENIENSNLEKDAPLEITETENADSDIELIEADSTKKIDSVNENNKADDVISTDKSTEDNVNIHDTVKDETADLEKEGKTIVLNGSNGESDPKPVEILTENDKSDVEINSNEKLNVPTEDSVENMTDSQLDGMENHQNDIDKHDNEIDSIDNDNDDDMDCGDNLVIDDIVDSDVELVEDAVKDAKDTSEVKVQNDLLIDRDTTVMDVDSPVGNEEGSVAIIPASKVILPIDLDNDNASNDKIEPIVNKDSANEDKDESVVIPDTEKDKTESAVSNTSILPIDLDNADDSEDTNLVLNVENTESVIKDNVDKDKAESVVDAEKEKTESSVTNSILRSHLDDNDSSKDTTTETSVIKSKDDDDEIIFIKECKKASDCTCVMCDGKKKSTDKKDKQDNEEKVGQKDSSAKMKKIVMPKIHEKLENLTKKGMEKLVNSLFAKFFAYESETGKIRELLGKLQSENATIKSVCQAQAKQLKELSHLHDKAVAEIEKFKAENNGGLPPMPVKITRSVGLQVKVSPPAEKKRPATAASNLNTRLASLKRKRGSPAPVPLSSPRPAASQQARSLPSSPLASPKSPAQSAAYRAATFSTLAARKSTGGMSPRFVQRGNVGRPLGLAAAGSAGGLRILPPRAVNSNAVNAAVRPILSPRAPVGRVITRSPAGGVSRPPTPATITVKPPSSSVETINLDDDDSPRGSRYQQSMKIVRPNNSVPVRITSTAGTTARAPGQGTPPRVYVPLSQGIKLRPATSSTGNILTSVANTSSSTTYILETSAGPIPFQTNSNVRLNLKSNVTTANAPVRLQYQGHPAPVPTTPAAVNLPLEARFKLVPAAPKLRVQLADAGKGIQLTWSLDSTPDMASIESYQLYAYQENKAMAISSNLWKNIGKLEALPLPMACTLTQFTAGHTYHFLVRAIDVFKRFSSFSNPGTIHLRT